MNTTSAAGGNFSLFSLKYSLSFLLIRLRTQAFPTFLPAMIPSRSLPEGLAVVRIRKWGVREREASRLIRE
jgi:hypothetical protein